MAPAAVVVVLIAGSLYYRLHRPKPLTEKDTIVLADFTNETGDPVFDETLRQGLSVQLEQSPFLSTVSDQQIQHVLGMMGQRPEVKLTTDIVRNLCQRLVSKAYISGSIATLGTQYVLSLKAVNCSSGDTLADDQERVSGKEQVLAALDIAAANLRRELGESLRTVETLKTPLEQATTPSLEALQAYSLGRKLLENGEESASKPLFQRAIQLDPNFAMAYASLGTAYHHLGDFSQAKVHTQKAYELRERVSQREKFYLQSHYHTYVTGNEQKSIQIAESWAQTYPRDPVPVFNIGGDYWAIGQFDKARDQFTQSLRLEAPRALDYSNLANVYLCLDKYKDASAMIDEAISKKFDSATIHFLSYQLAFLQDDAAAMSQQVQWSAGKPGVEDWLSLFQADTAAYHGELEKARNLYDRAIASGKATDDKEVAAGDEAVASLREALFGNATKARQRAAAALQVSKGQYPEYASALALALSGDAHKAETLADGLASQFPEDTLVQFNYLPALRAEIALGRGAYAKAIEVLEPAVAYDLASYYTLPLYPAYFRGLAYLEARQGGKASAEFQKILDHRGLVWNDPIGALAHLQIGRAYVLSGDTVRGKAAYNDFLTLWKDADPDIPILKEAKAEYAKLQ